MSKTRGAANVAWNSNPACGVSVSAVKPRNVERVILLLLIALGTWFRLRNLGALGFIADEGIQALAVQGIFQHGVPQLDSGIIYTRAPLYLYQQAALSALFDLNEFWMRLPSAIWGAAAVIPSYLLGKTLFDRPVGLLAATVVACSTWEVEMSRYARFYTVFQFFFLFAVLYFYRGFGLGEPRARYGFVIVTIAAGLSHKLGQLLPVLFLIPLVADRLSSAKRRGIIAWAFGVGGILLGYRALVGSVQGWVNPVPVGSVSVEQASEDPNLFVQELAINFGIEGLDLPSLEPFFRVGAEMPLVLGVLGLMCLAGSFLAVMRIARDAPYGPPLMAVLALWSGFFHQFGVTVLVILGILVGVGNNRFQIWERFGSEWIPLPLLAVAWAGILKMGLDLPVRDVVDTMFGFPNMLGYFFKWLVTGWPIVAVGLVAGSMALLARYLRNPTNRTELYILGSLYLPALVASLFESHAESRYIFHLYPLIILIFVWFAVGVGRRIRDRWLTDSSALRWTAVIVGISVLLLSTQDSNPVAAWRVGERTYESTKRADRSVISWWRYADYHQDYESPSLYVRDRLRTSDRILVLGNATAVANITYYAGRSDYMIDPSWDVGVSGSSPYGYIDEEGQRVYYVSGSHVLKTQNEIRSLIVEMSGGRGRLWIVGDRHLIAEGTSYYPAEISSYLRGLMDEPEFVGRDGEAVAVRIE